MIARELGHGGMGVVYQATHAALNRTVALKMLPGGQRDEKARIRFLAEAEAIAAVVHPNVVQVYDYGAGDGLPFMALEFLPGGTLGEKLKREGRLPPDAAVRLVEKIARGVQAAHDRGIVHRDLKPANVLLDDSGEPKVTDFGLAKRSGGAALTCTQAVMGTPAYMAPEQARGNTKFVTPAADVYALGVILYECLTGTKPFDATDTLVLLRQIAEDNPEPPRKRVLGTPRDLELICLKCLAKEPGERYATAGLLADDLTRFANREPVSVRAAGWIERGYRWAKRRPTTAAAYTLTVLTVFLGSSAGLTLTLWQRAEASRQSEANAKVEAEGARDRFEQEKTRAEGALSREQIARLSEAQAREELARLDYYRTVDLAHRKVLEKNIGRARELLALCRPDLRGWEWGYVDRLAHRELRSLVHPRIPISISFSRDGTRVAVGTFDQSAPVWDLRTGKVLFTLRSSRSIGTVTFSPDGNRIAAVSAAGTTICDGHTGRELFVLKSTGDFVRFCADGKRIVTLSNTKVVKTCDAKTGEVLASLTLADDAILSAGISPDGTRIATAGYGGVRIWDAADGKRLLELGKTADRVDAVAFSPDGRWVVDGRDNGTATVWDARSGEEIRRVTGHAKNITAVALNADGTRLVTGSEDGAAKVWSLATGEAVLDLTGHTKKVTAVAFSPDGKRIISLGLDFVGRVWNAENGRLIHADLKLTTMTEAVAMTADGGVVVTGGYDQTVRVWDGNTGKLTRTIPGVAKVVSSVALSPDGWRVVTACLEPLEDTAHVWDVATGRKVASLRGHAGGIYSAAFSRDGSRVATGGSDQTVRVWDVKRGQELLALKYADGLVTALRFTPDGAKLVAAWTNGTVHTFDASSPPPIVPTELIPGLGKRD